MSDSKPPFSLGIVPVLIVATIALVAGYAIAKATDSGDSSTAPAPAQVAPTPQQQAAVSELSAKADDAGAKVNVVAAAESIETCATDNNGTYSKCGVDQLTGVHPELAEVKDQIKVESTATTYKISVTQPDTGNVFTLERGSNGATQKSCTKPGSGGCPSSGAW